VPFGSGLNSLHNQPHSDLHRVTWDDCYINLADCLTPKGFMCHRVRLGEGVYLDVYNLHADAGDQANDEAARRENLAQMTSYIRTQSVVNAGWSWGKPTRDTHAPGTASRSSPPTTG